jgi:hypothetical protein
VLAVRAQIFHELNTPQSAGECRAFPVSALSGITTYTLDSLARSFGQWAHLALRQLNKIKREPQQLGALSQKSLSLPFLDIVTQEKLVRQILFACGYSGRDALPLAKQILALVDHPLPEGTRLTDFLHPLESRHVSTPMDEAYLSSAALLLCALQITQEYFDTHSFLRTQTLLRKGFLLTPQIELEELMESLPPSVAALQGTLLWLEAPRYGFEDTPSGSQYKPGNYAADVSADLLEVCVSLRQTVRARSENDTAAFHELIIGETCVTAPSERTRPPKTEHTSQTSIKRIVVHGNLINLYSQAQSTHARSGATDNALRLLGDLPLDHMRIVHPAAGGSYSVCEAEIDSFLAQTVHHAEGRSSEQPSLQLDQFGQFSQLCQQSLDSLEALWEEHLLLEEMLAKKMPQLLDIARAYGVATSSTSSSDRFRFAARDLSMRASEASMEAPVLETLPQALSFLPSSDIPRTVVVFGKPHGSRQPSFNVRILNQIFSELRKHGAQIATPASDLMYRVFWRSIFLGSMPVTLHLVEASEVAELERILKIDQSLTPLVTLNSRSSAASGIALGEANLVLQSFLSKPDQSVVSVQSGNVPATLPTWAGLRNSIREVRGLRPLPSNETSVTAFEDYVACPFLFFMRHVLLLGGKTNDALSYDRLDSGTRMHSTLESFSSSINFALTHPDYPQRAKQQLVESFLDAWLTQLRTPAIFTSLDGAAFKSSAAAALGQAQKRTDGAPFDQFFCLSFLNSLEQCIDTLYTTQNKVQNSAKNKMQNKAQVDVLSDVLGIEARKRMLISFLEAECQQFSNDRRLGLLRRISHIEKPVAIKLGTRAGNKLYVRGKIDRVDNIYLQTGLHEANNHTRIEIIDYKTSTPKEQYTTLSLFPNQLGSQISKSSTQSSVQGGLYLAALFTELNGELNGEHHHDGKDQMLEDEVQLEPAVPMAFSLYRIGSLKGKTNPVLSASVDLGTLEGRNELTTGISAYDSIADKLLAGRFPATPTQAALCQSCEFRVQCPGAKGIGETPLNDNDATAEASLP